MENRAHYVIVGGFVIAILVGILVSIVWLTRLQFQREGAIYDIFFRGSVSGLNDGAPVNYNGVPIGRVIGIRLNSENVERIRVRIVVDAAIPIKQDAVASLETQGITGQAFVQISGGTNASPPAAIPPGRAFPVIASRPSHLQEVVTSAPQLLSGGLAPITFLARNRPDQLQSPRSRRAGAKMYWPRRSIGASRLGKPPLALILLTLAYVGSGRLGLMLAVPPGYGSAIFPPAGIAVAAMLIAGRATLPWTFLGSFLLNLWTGYAGVPAARFEWCRRRCSHRCRFDGPGGARGRRAAALDRGADATRQWPRSRPLLRAVSIVLFDERDTLACRVVGARRHRPARYSSRTG